MKNFRYNTQTAMFFGRGCVKENAAFFKGYGDGTVICTSKIY